MCDKKQNVVSGEFAVEKFDCNDDFTKSRIFSVRSDEMEEQVTDCDQFRSVRHSSAPMWAFSEHGVIMHSLKDGCDVHSVDYGEDIRCVA